MVSLRKHQREIILIPQMATMMWSAWKINFWHKRMVNSHQLRAPENPNLHPNSKNSRARQGREATTGKKLHLKHARHTQQFCCYPQVSGSRLSKQQQMGEGRRLNRKENSGTSRNEGEVAEGPHLRGEEGHPRHQSYWHSQKNLHSPDICFDARKRKG